MDQLAVSEAEFWECVQNNVKPERGEPRVPEEALPASLVHQLITTLGLSDAEVAKMTKAEAIERMQKHWSKPPE
jgi:hypothetical protein